MHFEFGKRIAALRKAHKITQAQLAEYLSVQPQTISRWEAEGGIPDVTLLPQIALFFGITLDELFGMTNMEQIDRLVYKYSVLRDERSFEEVTRSIENAVSSIEEQLSAVPESEAVSLREQRDQLLAWKVHIYIKNNTTSEELNIDVSYDFPTMNEVRQVCKEKLGGYVVGVHVGDNDTLISGKVLCKFQSDLMCSVEVQFVLRGESLNDVVVCSSVCFAELFFHCFKFVQSSLSNTVNSGDETIHSFLAVGHVI